MVHNFKSISSSKLNWTIIYPNKHGDWINPRNEGFADLIPLAPEKKFDSKTQSVFSTYSLGVASGRDSWVSNFSEERLKENIECTISFYNEQRELIHSGAQSEVTFDSNRDSWNRDWRKTLNKNKPIFIKNDYQYALYRPFIKQHLYFADDLNQERYQLTKLFPTPKIKNLAICLSGIGSSKGFSVLIMDKIPDLQLMFNGQCFSLCWYEENKQQGLFEQEEDDYICHDGISDWMLKEVRNHIGNNKITKEMIFYYIYGLLHSPDYRETFASNLKK